jgi:hypothetical protein
VSVTLAPLDEVLDKRFSDGHEPGADVPLNRDTVQRGHSHDAPKAQSRSPTTSASMVRDGNGCARELQRAKVSPELPSAG